MDETLGAIPKQRLPETISEVVAFLVDLERRASNLEQSLPALLANQQRHGSLLMEIHQSAL